MPSTVFLIVFLTILGLLITPKTLWWQKTTERKFSKKLFNALNIERDRETAFRRRQQAGKVLRRLERIRGIGRTLSYGRTRPKRAIALALFISFHAWLHFSNPYTPGTFVQQPYTTRVEANGEISYTQNFKLWVWSNPFADALGYYKQGMMIVENTLFGGRELPGTSPEAIIDEIHMARFKTDKPYLISGDQFNVLYPRNLGVFYNQLLSPETTHSQKDWELRQRIYLQSVLYAIDGLADADEPKTTIIPIGPHTAVTTQVHPGDVASDSVYGLLYTLDRLATYNEFEGYTVQTTTAAKRILHEKHPQLSKIVQDYLRTVQGENERIRSDIHLASARDGVSRKSSFYDNIILWKTLQLADKLDIYDTGSKELSSLKNAIKDAYWQQKKGYYKNDIYDTSFSSDWLIGYPTGFFDLDNKIDRARTKQTLDYIFNDAIDQPLPIKYQIGEAKDVPFIIKMFVPQYGGEAIWSYWGAQYITLLIDMNDTKYTARAQEFITKYDQAILRDKGFAETYNPDGTFLRHGLYKSIRVTGWVVQYEWAKWRLKQQLTDESLLP